MRDEEIEALLQAGDGPATPEAGFEDELLLRMLDELDNASASSIDVPESVILVPTPIDRPRRSQRSLLASAAAAIVAAIAIGTAVTQLPNATDEIDATVNGEATTSLGPPPLVPCSTLLGAIEELSGELPNSPTEPSQETAESYVATLRDGADLLEKALEATTRTGRNSVAADLAEAVGVLEREEQRVGDGRTANTALATSNIARRLLLVSESLDELEAQCPALKNNN